MTLKGISFATDHLAHKFAFATHFILGKHNNPELCNSDAMP